MGDAPDILYLKDVDGDGTAEVRRTVFTGFGTHNVQGLLGMLPGEQFEVKIQTSRDNLAGLLASAMMTGYFLRQMEQRMELDTSLLGCGDLDTELDADPGELRS